MEHILGEIVHHKSMTTPIDYVLCIGCFLGKVSFLSNQILINFILSMDNDTRVDIYVIGRRRLHLLRARVDQKG